MAKVKAFDYDLPNFTLVAPSIWELHPSSVYRPSYSPAKDVEAPSLILLCTWTGAQKRHITKYTAEYQSLLPTTRIMVITTTAADFALRSSARKQERLKPAVERILSYKYLTDEGLNGGILMHVFSEGGSGKACELAEVYYNLTSERLPVSALCFDSTPGHPRYLRLCHALKNSLPPVPILRHTSLVFGSAVIGAFWLTYRLIKGWENNTISRTRRRVNDPTHFDPNAPRCYLYSKEDTLVAWQDVYEHVEESMLKGIRAHEVLFEGSGHVEHAKQEPERYWGAVMETWRNAGSANLSEKQVPPRLEVAFEELDFQVIFQGAATENRTRSKVDSERALLPASSYRDITVDELR